ncbi:MAG: DNA-3-methyladenine glycosylase [Cytophagales bacterium]|nr:MAG: DNA-3-methyladenine glycosylase [Cytophagales bacterium]
MPKLNLDFYLQENVLLIAQQLIGKQLCTNFNNQLTTGIIVETEAYKAPEDKASHAYGNKLTERTSIFYKEGGVAYVYLCYGIHKLFNIITNHTNIPHAVLIRAIEPTTGIDIMQLRRKKIKLDYSLTRGPGCVSEALGIEKIHNGMSLLGNQLWIEDSHSQTLHSKIEIASGSRIGISYAEEYASKPWRFWAKNNSYVSFPLK